jgi:response regulator RpfG family c-di-GMP phosphodiesterase
MKLSYIKVTWKHMNQTLPETILVFSPPAINRLGETADSEFDLDILRCKIQAIGYKMVWANTHNTDADYALFAPPAAILIHHDPEFGSDALALCCQLRRSIITAHIPIIIYSSIRDISVMNLAYQLGASYYQILEPSWGHKSYDVVNELCDVTLRLIDAKIIQHKRSKAEATLYHNFEYVGMGLAPSHLNN